MKVSKSELARLAARIEVTNWIHTGNAKQENEFFLIEKAIKRYCLFSVKELKNIVKNSTIHNETVLNASISAGVR